MLSHPHDGIRRSHALYLLHIHQYRFQFERIISTKLNLYLYPLLLYQLNLSLELLIGMPMHLQSYLLPLELLLLLLLLEPLPHALKSRLMHLILHRIRSIHNTQQILISLHLIIIYVHALGSLLLVIQLEYG